MKLVSACLLGMPCRWDGRHKQNGQVIGLLKKEALIGVCPELLGGLKVPREQVELTGDGVEVLEGDAWVLTRSGHDLTERFIRGAEATLKIARLYGIRGAIFKQKSPSCGCGKITDGSFTGATIDGDGVTTALLKMNGIKVFSEEDL